MALVGFGLVLAKADLQDAAVCKWLAQRLIHRAAQRLPCGEQARWEEEWLRHDLDVPGRLPPIARAVSIFVRAGGWGRMLRDAPPRSQVLIARLRAAWVWLRSLPLSERPGPAVQARADVADAVGVAGAVYGVYRPGTNDHSIDVVVPRSGVYVLPSRQAGLPHLSDEEFVAWLAHQRQDFEDAADRKMAESGGFEASCLSNLALPAQDVMGQSRHRSRAVFDGDVRSNRPMEDSAAGKVGL